MTSKSPSGGTSTPVPISVRRRSTSTPVNSPTTTGTSKRSSPRRGRRRPMTSPGSEASSSTRRAIPSGCARTPGPCGICASRSIRANPCSPGGRGAETPHTAGEVVILDDSYQEIARVGMGGELPKDSSDLHETTITDDDTMFLLSYVKTQTDLSEVGGDADGWVWEGVVQEVDIATGEPLFEWRSLDDVPVEQSEAEFKDGEGTEDEPYDYIHLNSVSEDDDGSSLLVSARNTHAVYQLDRKTADLNWVLGGKASDFEMGEGATFAWQHDAQRRSDGTLTLFDN